MFENYDIDGIQFDDYFYPEEKTLNDVGMHKKYVENGGALSLGEWRRENVNSFISSVYSLVKSYGETKVFGVSPSAKLSFNDSVYADVRLWCKESGYIDYIMPQIYYGFENSFMPFEDVACEWASLERCDEVRLYCGFAVYKCGEKDENAGEGVNEWKVNDNMISEQYRCISENNLFSGFSLFSYSYCFGWNKNDICTAEMGYLTSML
ncbi:MAG: family 10 glycosylhydrolase [Clostridia bacterium]|nr:family 10 glycosylhydrolase [Clostridia bacterium]